MAPPLNSYAKRILDRFAEEYPGSAHYRGGRKLRKAGWQKLFPEIEGDVEAKEQFLGGVEALITRGIVSVKWKRFREGDEVEALYLEDPGQLYSVTGGKRPERIREEMLAVLSGWKPLSSTGTAVKETVAAKLSAYHPLPVNDAGLLADICTLLDLRPEEAARRPLRAVSVHLYNDSKRLEHIIKIADLLCRDAIGETASGLLGLERKYPEVTFAADAELVFRDGTVWTIGGRPLSLPLATLEDVSALRFPERRAGCGADLSADANAGTAWKPAVLSVENKESFFVAVGAGAGAGAGTGSGTESGLFSGYLYTGGYPGPGEAQFLNLAREAGAEVYHFSDLDPEGLKIFEAVDRLCEETARPFLMDIPTYRSYAEYGYTLDRHSIHRLDSVTHPCFGELKKEMKRTGKGVEQEVIPL
jgi:hypothetical protein